MLFLGIDPGLSEVGFGVIRVEGGKAHCLDYGIFRTPSDLSLEERLGLIKKDLEELLTSGSFAAAGVEELFFVKNVTNGIKVAHARGVILQSLHAQGIPLFSFKPKEVKAGVCGYGGADKLQVQTMVQRLLSLPSLPKPHDAADALAIALCTAEAWKKMRK